MRFNHFIEIIVKKFNYVMQITSTKNIIKNPQTSEVPFSPFFHPLTLPGYPHRPWGFIGNTIGITPKWQSYLSTNWSTTYFPIIFMVFDEVIFDKVSNTFPNKTKRLLLLSYSTIAWTRKVVTNRLSFFVVWKLSHLFLFQNICSTWNTYVDILNVCF